MIVSLGAGQHQLTPAPAGMRGDYGAMQVRAPTPLAAKCGVTSLRHLEKMVEDIEFSYQVGTCVLAQHFGLFKDKYEKEKFLRFEGKKRDIRTRQFLGLEGPLYGSEVAHRRQRLVVLERYNWGYANLYAHPQYRGYARNLIAKFEYFQESEWNASTDM
jgi:hypothetical protein